MTVWLGRVEIGGLHDQAGFARGLCAGLGHLRGIEREHGGHGALRPPERPAAWRAPRAFTARTASAKESVPATTCADHSPSEWPAASAGSTPCSASTRAAATLTVMMAGCVFSVSRRSSSGPSKQSCESGKPSAASASAKVCSGNGKSLGKLAAHANGLRTLPRKEKSNLCGHFR